MKYNSIPEFQSILKYATDYTYKIFPILKSKISKVLDPRLIINNSMGNMFGSTRFSIINIYLYNIIDCNLTYDDNSLRFMILEVLTHELYHSDQEIMYDLMERPMILQKRRYVDMIEPSAQYKTLQLIKELTENGEMMSVFGIDIDNLSPHVCTYCCQGIDFDNPRKYIRTTLDRFYIELIKQLCLNVNISDMFYKFNNIKIKICCNDESVKCDEIYTIKENGVFNEDTAPIATTVESIFSSGIDIIYNSTCMVEGDNDNLFIGVYITIEEKTVFKIHRK